MKITASNLSRTSFSSLGSALGGASAKAANTDSKRLKNLKEALDQLRIATDPKQMAKKAAAKKIGMLQQRLMELKQMLLHASPEQAKALARELKSIAGELASAAKAAAGASGGGQGASMLSPVVSGAEGAESASASSEAETASAATSGTAVQSAEDAAADQGAKAAQEDENSASSEKRLDDSSDSIEMPDKVLKDMLKEAKKLLKEAIDMVKAKMGHGDKESRKDVEDAEKKLREISLATNTQLSSASFYTSQGLATLEGSSIDGVAAGSNISLEA